ncbi:2'-5' RNA ligase family protein [Planobispora rosea]|uniref:2'-5' RNA ligase family protein n=1 Tax=Planobispora rosea TaxID=35762 RepID=UPI001C40119B|nr:2'-5' RNA ligase family protein [Planobispora rosea]
MTESRMRDHWWWRPGWRVGRRMYTFHTTFDDQPELHRLVTAYQTALDGLGGLDIIPLKWLHLTMQGIGFTDEVSTDDVDAIAAAVTSRLKAMEPVELTFTRPVTDPEALQFHVQPAEGIREVRRAVRAGIAEVWGADRIPDPEEWTPHVSIAYSNSDGPVEPYAKALDGVEAEPVTVRVSQIQLIVIDRDERLYRWDTHIGVPLGLSTD